MRTGRDRQAAVGIHDRGGRPQRLSDIAVSGATAPAQMSPSAERIAQVEQHRRLPQAVIRERTLAGLKAAKARGRKGCRKFALSKAQVRLAQAAMGHRDTSVSELCRERSNLDAGGARV